MGKSWQSIRESTFSFGGVGFCALLVDSAAVSAVTYDQVCALATALKAPKIITKSCRLVTFLDFWHFEKTCPFYPNDSKHCGGAVGALQKLGKVSDLSGRAFHNFCNTAALPTQD